MMTKHMNILGSVVAVALMAAAITLMGGLAHAETVTSREDAQFNLRIDLPDRWSTSSHTFDDEWWQEFIYIEDRENVADVSVVTWRFDPSGARYTSAAEWAKATLLDLRDPEAGKSYNEGYRATEDETKRVESTERLGSGEEAFMIRAELTINGNRRQVAFIAFERQVAGHTNWYHLFVANSGKFADLTTALQTILQGTGYTTPPTTASLGG